MRGLMVKTLLFALCLTFAFTTSDATSLWTVPGDMTMTAGMLLAVCSTASAGWLRSPGPGRRTGVTSGVEWGVSVAYAGLALIEPRWCVFLPLIAYDMAHARPIRVGTPIRPTVRPTVRFTGRSTVRSVIDVAIRLSWLVPLLRCAAPYVMGVDASALIGPSALATIVLCTGTGFALGWSDGDVVSLRRSLRAERDRTREMMRGTRTRIADLDEERSRAVRIATLGERTRIAREIHDNVGHLLTRAIMQAKAGGVVADATGDAVASRGFAELGGTLDDAMTMVRRSVHDLEDDGTDFAAQIDAAAHAFDGASPGFRVTLTCDVASAPAPVARCFATVIRESLSNTARHSGALSATVTLRDFPAIWQLVVLDRGPRLDESAEPDRLAGEAPRGMGLADIAERVRAIGGTSACGPYGEGWRVFAAVPKAPWTVRRRPSESPATVGTGAGNHTRETEE